MENAFLEFLFLAGLMALRDVASTLIILGPTHDRLYGHSTFGWRIEEPA
jgi:hypothetical protein